MPAQDRMAIRNRRDGRAQKTRRLAPQVRTARTTHQALHVIEASASARLPKNLSGQVGLAKSILPGNSAHPV
jgi:hypothetical protein